MVIEQHPHRVIISVPQDVEQDENGDWIETEPSNEPNIDVKGRFVVNGNRSSQFIVGVDGKSIAFFGIVYMPPIEVNIVVGASILVQDENGTIIAKGNIKQRHNGQINTRVWL